MHNQEAVVGDVGAAAGVEHQQQMQMMAGDLAQDENARLQEANVGPDGQQQNMCINNAAGFDGMQQHQAQAHAQEQDQSTMANGGAQNNAAANGMNMHSGYNYQQQSAQEASTVIAQQQ